MVVFGVVILLILLPIISNLSITDLLPSNC